MDTLIANVTAVTMNPKMEVLFGAYIGIEGGKIVSVSRQAPKEPPQTVIDGTGMVAMPGLVNCHTHLASSVLRSYTDDLGNAQALEELLKKEAKMDSRCAQAAALLSIAECLRFGVTSVSDLYYYPDATAKAVAESGIKANLALSSYRFIDQNEEFDFDTDEQCKELVRLTEKWNGFDEGRIKIDAGIYAEYTSNYKLWEGLVGYASEQGLGLQLHLAQTPGEVEGCLDRTGMNPGELLNCHGLFNVPVTAAGCGYLEPVERKILGRKKVTAVALPALRYQCIAMFLQPVIIVTNMLFQSIGKSGRATFLACCRQGVFFIPLILTLPRAFGLLGVEICQPIADVLTFFVTVPFLFPFLRQLVRMDEAEAAEV